jgi:hypothetical protein
MYTCRDASEHMTEMREGALSGWLRFWHRFHITICPHCRACNRQFDETVKLAGEIPSEPAPERMVESAMSAFRQRGKRSE